MFWLNGCTLSLWEGLRCRLNQTFYINFRAPSGSSDADRLSVGRRTRRTPRGLSPYKLDFSNLSLDSPDERYTFQESIYLKSIVKLMRSVPQGYDHTNLTFVTCLLLQNYRYTDGSNVLFSGW